MEPDLGIWVPLLCSALARTLTSTWPWKSNRITLHNPPKGTQGAGLGPSLGLWVADRLLSPVLKYPQESIRFCQWFPSPRRKKSILKVLTSYTLVWGSPPGFFSAPLYLICAALVCPTMACFADAQRGIAVAQGHIASQS